MGENQQQKKQLNHMSEKFNAQICLQACTEIMNPTPQIPPMLTFLEHVLYFMSEISSVISLAFSDVDEKRKILDQHQKDYNTASLYEIVEKEIANNLHQLNGENNKKINKDYKTYVSAARTVNVLLRFFKFLKQLFTRFQTEVTFKECVVESYKAELGPHHAWLVRKGAEAAFCASPNRDKVTPLIQPDPNAFCVQICGSLDKLCNDLQAYYEKNKLLELP